MTSEQDNIINCPECGQAMDISQLPPYTNAVCPACGGMHRVKTRMGPYKILGKLGKGGMSVVYRAEDSVLGREVALKVLNETYADDAVRGERFEREARIMARVSHENLVQIYSVGRDHGLFYIAMELVDGCGLDALITQEERIPEDLVLQITSDIVRGLDAAWQAGLMHRDIKPANVLQAADGEAKIVDFGLSLLHSESDVEREIWVTPYYAAPETLLRRQEDFRTDMYALGATMYHMLVGAPPKVDASQSSDILLESKKTLPPMDQVVNDISPMTCFIVDKLMTFNLEDRFSSYAELMNAVEQALYEYHQAQASGQTWAERRFSIARQQRRAKHRMIALIVSASILTLGLGIWGAVAWRQSSQAASVKPPVLQTPTVGEGLTSEDAAASESKLERSIRFGNLFKEAQQLLDRGELVKAGGMFGDLSAQADCPLSTALWSGLNQVLCLWGRGQFPEGVQRLSELRKMTEDCKDSVELDRCRDVADVILYLSKGEWNATMPGLQSDSELAVHYYTGMALKSWYVAQKWEDYGSFRDKLLRESRDGHYMPVRALAGAWLNNLKEYTAQYEGLKRLRDMPEKTVAQVEAKRSAMDRLREQMLIGEIPAMPPAYAALESMLDHLRTQYQVAKKRDAEEAARLAKLQQLELEKKAQEEKARKAELLAAQSRTTDDICREVTDIMAKTGDYAKASAAYRAAEQVVKSPYVKQQVAVRREMTDKMIPLFSLMGKILPSILEKKTTIPLVLNNGDKMRLTGMEGHLLKMEPMDAKNGPAARLVSWDDLGFNAVYILARECRQKQAADFQPLAETYSKPLLIFGYLTNTISDVQQENALLQMDRSFIEQWNRWLSTLDALEIEEPKSKDSSPAGSSPGIEYFDC